MATNGKKKNDCCCGKTVTETNTTVTEYGTNGCHMPKGTLQYIGARYVPVFADPVEWSDDRPYEHLMMVQNLGNTYISKQAVPVGIELPTVTGDNEYWVLISDFSAQVEEYRQIVDLYRTEVETYTEKVSDKPYMFENVSALQLFEDFEEGDYAFTDGYYNANDGGAACYLVVNDGVQANNIDSFEVNDGMRAVLQLGDIVYAAQYGCIGQCNENNVNAALQNTSVVFNKDIEVSSTIVIGGENRHVEFCNIDYTGNAHAISCSATYSVIEFRNIRANSGKGILIDCKTNEVNNTSIVGDYIRALNTCIEIVSNGYGYIWGRLEVGRLLSQYGNCILLDMNEPDPDSYGTSFVGQLNTFVGQMQATRDYAVSCIADAANTTITGLYFTPQTSIEASKGGFRFVAENGGSIKMVNVDKIRIYEKGFTLPILSLVGYCFNNLFSFSSAIVPNEIENQLDARVNMTIGNEIAGGISSPTGYRFADKAIAYATANGHFLNFIDNENRYTYRLNANKDYTLFTAEDTSVANWRIPDYIINQSGKPHTISNLPCNREYIVSQTISNDSTLILVDEQGNTMFDGSQIAETGRRCYRVLPYRSKAEYYEVNSIDLFD